MANYRQLQVSRPYVTLNCATTLDGKITSVGGDSRISSKFDLVRLHRLRASSDAIMIGIGTVLADNPRLTVRFVEGRNPVRIIVDSGARTPPKARLFDDRTAPVIIATSNRAHESRVKALINKGAEVMRCGSDDVDLQELSTWLSDRGIKKILLEGGGRLNWSMLRLGLVDEVIVAIAPCIIGGRKGKTMAEGIGVSRIKDGVCLSLKGVKKMGNEVLLSYNVLR